MRNSIVGTPLETLLLVSKAWHIAALSDAKLWSSFNIYLYWLDNIHYWNACILRRLNRCPPPVLLDVRIRIPPYPHRSYDAAFRTLLVQLVGKSGEVARRWRRFVLKDATYIPATLLQHCLSFPTPRLEDFRLYRDNLPGGLTLLPDVSSLKRFYVSGRVLPAFPNLANATNIHICVRPLWGDWNEQNEQAIALAINLVTMKIHSHLAPFKLTATYRLLQTLEFGGDIYNDCLSTFSAPILNNLTLAFQEGESFRHVLSCEGINLSAIQKLHIRCEAHRVDEDNTAEYLYRVRQLFTTAINLQVLVLGHAPVTHLILRLLDDECRSLYQFHPVHLVIKQSTKEWRTELGPGESGKSSIGQLTKDIGCVDGCVMGGHSYRPYDDDIF